MANTPPSGIQVSTRQEPITPVQEDDIFKEIDDILKDDTAHTAHLVEVLPQEEQVHMDVAQPVRLDRKSGRETTIFRNPFVAFLLIVFVIAPGLCFLVSLVLGGLILGAVEKWSFYTGFWYVSANIAGLPSPLNSAEPKTTEGKVVDVIVCLICLVCSSIIIGVSGMLAFVGRLPDRLRLTTTPKSLLAVFIVIPTCVALISVVLGAILQGFELAGGHVELAGGHNVTFAKTFYFVTSGLCGIGTPLTSWQPQSTLGNFLVCEIAFAANGVIGVIIGIIGGVVPLKDVVTRYDIWFGDSQEDEDTPTLTAAAAAAEGGGERV